MINVDMQEYVGSYYLGFCDKNDVVFSWWHARFSMWIILYEEMLYDYITNTLIEYWEVEIDRESTNGMRGMVYLMISWEPLLMRESM